MKIVGVVGMPGSGKTLFARIAKKQGCSVLSMGDVVREWAARKNVGSSNEDIGNFANNERIRHGPEIWAKRTAEKLRSHEQRRIVIEGIRSTHEVEYFKRHFGADFCLIAIVCPASLRYRRLLYRVRHDAPRSVEDFKDRDERELSWGIGELINKAEVVIINDGTVDDFCKKSMKVIERVFQEE